MNCQKCGCEYDDGTETCPGCMASLRFARRTGSAMQALAAEIARELFTDGMGKRADRLVMQIGGWPGGCGWSETGARDAIERVLARSPNSGISDSQSQYPVGSAPPKTEESQSAS